MVVVVVVVAYDFDLKNFLVGPFRWFFWVIMDTLGEGGQVGERPYYIIEEIEGRCEKE